MILFLPSSVFISPNECKQINGKEVQKSALKLKERINVPFDKILKKVENVNIYVYFKAVEAIKLKK